MNAVEEPLRELARLQQFAVDQLGSRLASDPNLVARFWTQIAPAVKLAAPDLTVFFCVVRRQREIFVLLEFVAGETLEDLVKRSDPAACERDIPLFCRLLDAFEGQTGKRAPSGASLELMDFGIRRLSATGVEKLHGALLAGPGGIADEKILGGKDEDRARVRAQLRSLWTALSGAPDRVIAPPLAVPAAWPFRMASSPLSIAVGTALLVLLMFYGIGGFLAKRTIPANAGKLVLPPISLPDSEPPRQDNAVVLARGARPVVETKLQYPEAARKGRVSGVVEMQVTIAEDGSVQNPRILSGDPLLTAGLAEQISKWIYEPNLVRGKPRPMTTELAIRFDLNP
jgi:TonB family protein